MTADLRVRVINNARDFIIGIGVPSSAFSKRDLAETVVELADENAALRKQLEGEQ